MLTYLRGHEIPKLYTKAWAGSRQDPLYCGSGGSEGLRCLSAHMSAPQARANLALIDVHFATVLTRSHMLARSADRRVDVCFPVFVGTPW